MLVLLTNMAVIRRQEPDVVNADLPFVSIVQDDLDHVWWNDTPGSQRRLELINSSREEAVVGLAPVHTHARPHNKLLFAVGFYLRDLKEETNELYNINVPLFFRQTAHYR